MYCAAHSLKLVLANNMLIINHLWKILGAKRAEDFGEGAEYEHVGDQCGCLQCRRLVSSAASFERPTFSGRMAAGLDESAFAVKGGHSKNQPSIKVPPALAVKDKVLSRRKLFVFLRKKNEDVTVNNTVGLHGPVPSCHRCFARRRGRHGRPGHGYLAIGGGNLHGRATGRTGENVPQGAGPVCGHVPSDSGGGARDEHKSRWKHIHRQLRKGRVSRLWPPVHGNRRCHLRRVLQRPRQWPGHLVLS